jgi:cytochrome c oxidase assembly protein subunit 15
MASSEHVGRVRGAASTAARRVTFPHIAAGTMLAVTATILLGIATKATGAGLACNARWPLCNGGLLNLFPADLPSFFEWIHRVVAGLTGFVILGAALAAWRRDVPPRARQAVTLGLVLLPLQVLLGRETVVTFTVPVLMAHFWTAFTIFAAFATATAVTWAPALTPRRLQAAAVGAAGLVPLSLLLHPPFVTGLTPAVHTFQYAVVLASLALVVTLAVGARRHLPGRAAGGVVALAFAHPLVVLASRHVYDAAWVVSAQRALAALLVAGLVVAAVRLGRVD